MRSSQGWNHESGELPIPQTGPPRKPWLNNLSPRIPGLTGVRGISHPRVRKWHQREDSSDPGNGGQGNRGEHKTVDALEGITH